MEIRKEDRNEDCEKMKVWKHFCTITRHKYLVMKYCFRVGLYKQGLLHDLSKYSPTEFLVGCKYYQGNRSPNNAEREKKGYSSAWLHHKGRNKHHYEYWIDYGLESGQGLCGMRMPDRYIYEMFLDRIAASKIYKKEKYTDRSPLEYYRKGMADSFMHPHTKEVLEHLLIMLAEKGEKTTLAYLRKEIWRNKKEHSF